MTGIIKPMEAGNTPSEFGGRPGFYANEDALENGGEPLSPWKARTALTQVDVTDPAAMPSHGTGGSKVAR